MHEAMVYISTTTVCACVHACVCCYHDQSLDLLQNNFMTLDGFLCIYVGKVPELVHYESYPSHVDGWRNYTLHYYHCTVPIISPVRVTVPLWELKHLLDGYFMVDHWQ